MENYTEVGTPLHYAGKRPLDEKQLVNTLAEAQKNAFNGYVCFVTELKKHIIFSLDNSNKLIFSDYKGEKGDKGDQGIQGIQGLKGDKGDQGIQGVQGEKGDIEPAMVAIKELEEATMAILKRKLDANRVNRAIIFYSLEALQLPECELTIQEVVDAMPIGSILYFEQQDSIKGIVDPPAPYCSYFVQKTTSYANQIIATEYDTGGANNWIASTCQYKGWQKIHTGDNITVKSLKITP